MKIGRYAGVQFRLNKYFLVLLLAFTMLGVLGRGLLVFLVVLWHEFAHVYYAKRLGLTVTEVELLPFGGVARIEEMLELEPGKDIRVALAGPLSNLFWLLVCAVIWLVGWREQEFWQNPAISAFLRANIMLFCFNLVPALPLDGGRILRSFLSTRVGHRKATEWTASMGTGIGWTLFVLGLAGLYAGLTGIDFFLIVIFLLFAARRERKRGIYIYLRSLARKKEEVKNRKLMKVRQLVVLANIPCFAVVDRIVPEHYHTCLILDEQTLVPKGELTEGQLLDAVMQGGADILVGDVLEKV